MIELFDQFRDRMLRYLLTFGLAVADAEEIVQDVFLALFRHLERGKSRANLRAWLFRVAHNQALKRRQRNRRDPDALAEDAIAIDPAPSPEDQALSTQSRRRMLAVVRALPEQDRRCLALRSEGLRYREIAGVLDMSLGAVSLSIARSLERIARATER